MVGSLGFLLTRSAQVEHHRAMHRRAFTKAVPIGSEISPEMTIPSIRVQAAKKRSARMAGKRPGRGVVV